MEQAYGIYKSPIGDIHIVWNETGISKIELFKEGWEEYLNKCNLTRDEYSSIFIKTKKQFEEYFQGKRKEFDIPLFIKGTEFQKNVWNAILEIPYGETRSYSEVAKSIGRPKAVRAIGQANHANCLPILIPCHRVIGKNGAMVGYAGAHIDVKVKLLELEVDK